MAHGTPVLIHSAYEGHAEYTNGTISGRLIDEATQMSYHYPYSALVICGRKYDYFAQPISNGLRFTGPLIIVNDTTNGKTQLLMREHYPFPHANRFELSLPVSCVEFRGCIYLLQLNGVYPANMRIFGNHSPEYQDMHEFMTSHPLLNCSAEHTDGKLYFADLKCDNQWSSIADWATLDMRADQSHASMMMRMGSTICSGEYGALYHASDVNHYGPYWCQMTQRDPRCKNTVSTGYSVDNVTNVNGVLYVLKTACADNCNMLTVDIYDERANAIIGNPDLAITNDGLSLQLVSVVKPLLA